MSDGGMSQSLWTWVVAVLAWASTETGKAILGGMAGGIFRFMFHEVKTISAAIMFASAGLLSSGFLAHVAAGAMSKWSGVLIDIGAAGFVVGFLAMSAAKLVLLFVDSKGKAIKGDDHDES